MRVLIADDDPIIRLDLKQMLENLSYEVVAEAEDGQQAVELAEQFKPDICLLDVKMPARDGIDAATMIAESGTAPTILLTAYSDSELIQRATEAGVFGYLVKPYKPSDLAYSQGKSRPRSWVILKFFLIRFFALGAPMQRITHGLRNPSCGTSHCRQVSVSKSVGGRFTGLPVDQSQARHFTVLAM